MFRKYFNRDELPFVVCVHVNCVVYVVLLVAFLQELEVLCVVLFVLVCFVVVFRCVVYVFC